MDWEDVKVFLAVANAGSIAGAARRLRISQVTVWRRIRALDESLEAALFERKPSGYSLSAQGAAFMRALDGVEQTLATARRRLALAGEEAVGEVRVAAPEFLAPLIAQRSVALHAAHPQLRIETVFASPLAHLGIRDADVAVRTERPLVAGFTVHRAHAVPFALYATRQYLSRRGAPSLPGHLAGHDFIDFDRSIDHAAPEAWRAVDVSEMNAVFRSSSPHARLAAMQAGLGLAMLPCCLVPADEDVVELWSADRVGALEFLICVHAELRNEPRIATTVKFLDETLEIAGRRREVQNVPPARSAVRARRSRTSRK